MEGEVTKGTYVVAFEGGNERGGDGRVGGGGEGRGRVEVFYCCLWDGLVMFVE